MKNEQIYKNVKLNERKCVNNLIKFYELASLYEIRAGENWYKEANEYCRELAGRFNLTIQQVAGIIAAFSPQCDWLQNKRYAVSFLMFPNNRVKSMEQTKKAKAILKLTNEAEIYAALSTVDKAFKTRSFFLNILNPDIVTNVTVDRHAIGAILQKPEEVKSIKDEYVLPTKKQYDFFQLCFVKAANKVNALPQDFQAIVWTVYRRLRELKEHETTLEFKPFINPDYDF